MIDPFLGTGALAAEAALLGARVVGIDRDPEMVRGALRNFAHLGVVADRVAEGDAGAVDFDEPDLKFDAVLTDLRREEEGRRNRTFRLNFDAGLSMTNSKCDARI